MEFYKSLDVSTHFDGEIWKCFMPEKVIKKTLKEGIKLITDDEEFQKYKNRFENYKKELTRILKELIQKKEVDSLNLAQTMAVAGRMWHYYGKTEFFYMDEAVKTNHPNLKELGIIKNEGRIFLNSIFFGETALLKQLTNKISRQTNIPTEDLMMHSKDELIDTVVGKKLNQYTIDKRKQGYSMHSKDGFIINKKINFVPGKEFKGTIACKGNYKGRAKVFQFGYDNYDMIKEFEKEMKKGDILVTETTGPELMNLVKKAGAIITNQGGLLSHAAIVSRELNIPCIIGTNNATEKIKDEEIIEIKNGRIKMHK